MTLQTSARESQVSVSSITAATVPRTEPPVRGPGRSWSEPPRALVPHPGCRNRNLLRGYNSRIAIQHGLSAPSAALVAFGKGHNIVFQAAVFERNVNALD